MKKDFVSIPLKVLLMIIFILAGFTFIVMGVYLLPEIVNYMEELGRPHIELMKFLFTGGIAGGAIIITYYGLRIVWGSSLEND